MTYFTFVCLSTKSKMDRNCTGIVVNRRYVYYTVQQFSFCPTNFNVKIIFILFHFFFNFVTGSMMLDFVALFSDCSLLYIFFVALSKSVIPFCRKFTSLSAWLTNLVVLLIYIFHHHVRCMYFLFFPFLSKETTSCLLPYPSVDFISSK